MSPRTLLLILTTGILSVSAALYWAIETGHLGFDANFNVQAIVALVSLFASITLSVSSRRILTTISSSVSTRYLGEFPEYLHDITALIKRSRKSLLIACDHPAYGALSSPIPADQYRAAIVEASARGVSVSCIFLDSSGGRTATDRQFSPDINGIVKPELAKRLLKAAEEMKYEIPRASSDSMSYGTLLDALSALDTLTLNRTFSGRNIKAHQTSSPLYLHFWIADGREAVFSLPNNVADDRERGFQTTDDALVRSLTNAAERYRSGHSNVITASTAPTAESRV